MGGTPISAFLLLAICLLHGGIKPKRRARHIVANGTNARRISLARRDRNRTATWDVFPQEHFNRSRSEAGNARKGPAMMAARVLRVFRGGGGGNDGRKSGRIREIELLNKLNDDELKDRSFDSPQSWHSAYKGVQYIYAGGLPTEMQEEDVLGIFEEYGPVEDVRLIRDRSTGEFKGFCFLKYKAWDSSVMAIDNLNGYELNGVLLKVDHAPTYRNEEEQEAYMKKWFPGSLLNRTKAKLDAPSPVDHPRQNSDGAFTQIQVSPETRGGDGGSGKGALAARASPPPTPYDDSWRKVMEKPFSDGKVDAEASTPELYAQEGGRDGDDPYELPESERAAWASTTRVDEKEMLEQLAAHTSDRSRRAEGEEGVRSNSHRNHPHHRREESRRGHKAFGRHDYRHRRTEQHDHHRRHYGQKRKGAGSSWKDAYSSKLNYRFMTHKERRDFGTVERGQKPDS